MHIGLGSAGLTDSGRARGTVASMRRYDRSVLGVLAVVAVSFAAMAFQLVPSPSARVPLLLLAPFVAWLASPDPASSGGCTECRATRRRQRSALGSSRVEPSTRAGSDKGSVSVSIGWEVSTDVAVTCERCQATRSVVKVHYVDRSAAPTAAEATVLARTYIG